MDVWTVSMDYGHDGRELRGIFASEQDAKAAAAYYHQIGDCNYPALVEKYTLRTFAETLAGLDAPVDPAPGGETMACECRGCGRKEDFPSSLATRFWDMRKAGWRLSDVKPGWICPGCAAIGKPASR